MSTSTFLQISDTRQREHVMKNNGGVFSWNDAAGDVESSDNCNTSNICAVQAPYSYPFVVYGIYSSLFERTISDLPHELNPVGTGGDIDVFSDHVSMNLYLQEQGDISAISVNDIHQGGIGDCFLLASIGELAWSDSSKIRSIIHDNGNGTETVTLFSGRGGKAPDFSTNSLQPIKITVDNVFPSNAANCAGQDRVGDQQEIWVQVLEKALAIENGGYAAISNGGWPMLVMEELTGNVATKISPSAVNAKILSDLQHAGNMMVFDTYNKNGLPYGLVSDHAYMYEGLENINGIACVKLGNPWGYAQPDAIPVSRLFQSFSQIDVCHR